MSTRVTPRMSHRATRGAPSVVASSSGPSHSSLETVIPGAQIRTELMWGSVFPTEAVRISGWRNVIDQLVARIGVVEAKKRNVAVELRDTNGQLVIANTKVTTLREEADRYGDSAPPRLAPCLEESTRPVDRSEREDYDDYHRADPGRDDYREDGCYYGGGRYAPEKRHRSEVYADRDDPYGDDDRTEDYRSAPSR